MLRKTIAVYFSALACLLSFNVPARAQAAAWEEAPVVNANYKVGVEDVLDVEVLRPEKLSSTVSVGPDGAIAFPHIGSVPVKGLTLNQIQNEVQRRLAN